MYLCGEWLLYTSHGVI